MTRLFTAVAIVSLALSGAVAPAALQARSNAGVFTAELAAPTSADRVVAGGTVFRCEGTTCTAPVAGERALRVCSELRREVGTIASFSSNGEALAADRLARCNG